MLYYVYNSGEIMHEYIFINYSKDVMGFDIKITHKIQCGECICKIETKRNFIKEYENCIKIDEEYFYNIYNKLLNIDYNEIIMNDNYDVILGDCDFLNIEIKKGFHEISYKTIDCHKYSEKRGLVEINNIVNEIFKKCNLNKDDLYM